ncbi:hypothetical protein NECAME_07983 [Necator americanus]|uniref:Uncharacterized protein n=1 Tax=Necator americanus TaxID=51031 RepID=W2TMP1_NECAM|nr:hypothetical protein NECAME_07983 [Necator americanus]ETN82406.1 hypothetical protein NECAME_07983 [Necator americanus]
MVGTYRLRIPPPRQPESCVTSRRRAIVMRPTIEHLKTASFVLGVVLNSCQVIDGKERIPQD